MLTGWCSMPFWGNIGNSFKNMWPSMPALNVPIFNFQPLVNMDSFNFGVSQLMYNQNMNFGGKNFNWGNFNSMPSLNFSGMFNPVSSAPSNSVAPSNNNTSTSETVRDGREVSDGTSITVPGVNYSIFGSSASEIKKLRPVFQQKVQKLWEYAKNKGWKITLTSGFRDIEKQKKLYAAYLARGKKPPVVAVPGSSRHNYGCAVDIRINGSGTHPLLLELGEYAKTIGVRQGVSFGERWHFDVDPSKTPKGHIGGMPSTPSESARQSTPDTPSGNSVQPTVRSSSSSYSVTPDSDYAAIYHETYNGAYVNTGSVIHFKYADANLGSTKAMKPAAMAAFQKMQQAMKMAQQQESWD